MSVLTDAARKAAADEAVRKDAERKALADALRSRARTALGVVLGVDTSALRVVALDLGAGWVVFTDDAVSLAVNSPVDGAPVVRVVTLIDGKWTPSKTVASLIELGVALGAA